MKLVSWNVNGIRSAIRGGFADFLKRVTPEIVCLQEVKASPGDVDSQHFDGFHTYWNCAAKKGYSGVVLASCIEPIEVSAGIGNRRHDIEGRVLTAEFPDYFVSCVYVPNSQRGLTRLAYRLQWDRAFQQFLRRLDRKKPVIFCGDLNVSHQEIDLANPRSNRRNAGFTDEERAGFTRLLKAGFVDTFREFHPGQAGHYTWWTMRTDARQRNIGWRLDYWVVSKRFRPRVKQSIILKEIMGSDHCPVMIEID
jgi:exodeoxyribonuclease-3